MTKMDIDDVVDLSLPATVRDLRVLTQNSGLTITPAPPPPPSLQTLSTPITSNYEHNESDGRILPRRVLRPRTEPKSYAETPDIVLLPAKVNGRQPNGNIDSETDDEEMPLAVPIKELTPAEIWEREIGLRKLREELRNEETKLVLLKKLKQSQHIMKENLIVTPTNVSPTINPLVSIPAALSKGSLSVTPTTAMPLPAHSKNRSSSILSNNRIQSNPGRTNTVLPPPRSSLPGGATLTPGGPPLRNNCGLPRTGPNLTITPSVTITPTSAPPAGIKPRNVPGTTINSVSITPAPPLPISSDPPLKNDRSTPREDVQTPAQRQAAAKLALRKQLEKTLLQIPPPKPPPPEMHFIPNPSNTEFVYLLGLEHVVDYLMTKERKPSSVLPPFRCAQCKIDFTPVWKWEKQAGKDPKVICEQCVTTNVKKALKAEHTNRLKTAFVKALQQEQEIEQRLATQSSPSPVDSHPTTPVPQPAPPVKSQTPTQNTNTLSLNHTQNNRPTSAPGSDLSQTSINSNKSFQNSMKSNQSSSVAKNAQQSPIITQNSSSTPTPAPISAPSYDKFQPGAVQLGSLGNLPGLNNLGNMGNSGNLGNLGNFANSSTAATAAAMQAFQQQVFRGLQQGLAAGNPQHMMQFTPLLYSYHLAMAQAAQAVAGKNPPSLADIQRAAEMQRQYLLEMIPPQAPGPSSSRQNNWKT